MSVIPSDVEGPQDRGTIVRPSTALGMMGLFGEAVAAFVAIGVC